MKDLIEKIKEIKSSPKGGAISFFAFYFFFFLILFFVLNIGEKRPITPNDYQGNKKSNFNFNSLTNKNNSFIYNIDLDGVQYKYVGVVNGDKTVFEFNENLYYFEGEKYYLNDNDNWNETNNPYVVDSSFVNVDKIVDLISLASFEAKTEYESGKVVYNYLISTNTINQYLYDINSDFMEEPNRLIISVENNNINNIVFNLDSFCSLSNICTKSLKVDLSFDDFGEVEEINIPI